MFIKSVLTIFICDLSHVEMQTLEIGQLLELGPKNQFEITRRALPTEPAWRQGQKSALASGAKIDMGR
jgi:hypothetical protein